MICPLTKENCEEDQCAWWIKLTANQEDHRRCALAWIPILLVEIRVAIERKLESP